MLTAMLTENETPTVTENAMLIVTLTENSTLIDVTLIENVIEMLMLTSTLVAMAQPENACSCPFRHEPLPSCYFVCHEQQNFHKFV
jgi:hypothetical protein